MSSDRSTTQTTGTGAGTFSAADLKRRMAEHETAKAAEELLRMREHEEQQKKVMEEFHKPPDRTPEQVMQLVASSTCTAYDCEFVALAQELRVPLVTTDKQLLRDFPRVARPLADYR